MRPVAPLVWMALTACANGPEAPAIHMSSQEVVDERGRVPDLVCPGARGCQEASGTFRVGVATRDITPSPDQDIWMAGFSLGRKATGIHDPIWARALSLSRGDTRLGLVVLDVVGYFHWEVLQIRQAAAHLDFDHILVASTHNHETQDTMGIWGPDFLTSGYHPEYMERIREASVSALSEAAASERAATLRYARAEAPHLVHDSRAPEVIDQALHAIAFHHASTQEVLASLVVWGNHPEALGGSNTLVSSDYPHYLRATLEAEYPGSTALFFAGNLGGLTNPLHVTGCPDAQGQETCPTGTFEKAEYIGAGAARAAIEALTSATIHDPDPGLSFRRHEVLFTTTNIIFVAAFGLETLRRPLVAEDGVVLPPHEAKHAPTQDVLEGRIKLQSEVNAFTIGPLSFVTVPGELYGELWLAGPQGESLAEAPPGADFPDAEILSPLQGLVPGQGPKIVINQANDALGYIIPESQWDAVEPHAYKPGGQYGEQNSLGPLTFPTLHQAVKRLYELNVR